MIVREATDQDLTVAAPFIQARLRALGLPKAKLSADMIRKWQETGYRLCLGFDPNWRDTIAVFFSAMPLLLRPEPSEPDQKGFEIMAWAVHADYPDPLLAADTLFLFGLNIAISEGAYHISIEYNRPNRLNYAASTGMNRVATGWKGEERKPASWRDTGDARTIIKRILERRPQWRTSLSSMTPR